MEKAKRHDSKSSMDRISQLPKEILQQILYFLSQKEAARTCVLSKAWRYLWCSRPNISFNMHDDTTFNGNKVRFLSILDRTLQTYHDQKLSLEEFHVTAALSDSDSVSLLDKWIPIIIVNMGVKKLHLHNYLESRPAGPPPPPPPYLLPSSVLFVAKSLQDLCLRGCNLFDDKRDKVIMLKNLKKLHLVEVIIEEETFQRIISNCPLIESMRLEVCQFFIKNKADDQFDTPIIIDVPITALETDDNDLNHHHDYLNKTLSVSSRVGLFGKLFGNLKAISLNTLELCSKSFDYFSYFPSLEELSLSDCCGFDEFQLLSHSIKYFSLTYMADSIMFCSIDAPNMIYFEFSGQLPESITFETTSSEWESHISPSFCVGFEDTSSWFLKLYQMLEALSLSDIYLDIDYFEFDFKRDDPNLRIEDPLPIITKGTSGHYKPVAVEELSLRAHSYSFPAFLNGLFSICRPRYIVVHVDEWDTEQKEVFEFLHKMLIIGNEELRHLQFNGQQDLEEVSMDTFEVSDITSDSLLECVLQNNRYRFGLKWREASHNLG